jgi:hypothetical protein
MDHRPDTDDPRIPDALASGLRRLETRHAPAWGDDDPVLASVGPAARGGSRRVVRWSAGLAAAAGLAVAAALWMTNPGPPRPARSALALSGPASPVTMLDAYRLRLMLDKAESPGGAWDANADGLVDGADVDALAGAAVRLGEASS